LHRNKRLLFTRKRVVDFDGGHEWFFRFGWRLVMRLADAIAVVQNRRMTDCNWVAEPLPEFLF
jgi:hypothetical protein